MELYRPNTYYRVYITSWKTDYYRPHNLDTGMSDRKDSIYKYRESTHLAIL